MTLRSMVEGFLEADGADGFRVRRSDLPDCVIAEKKVTAHNFVTWLVFVVPEAEKAAEYERKLLERVEQARRQNPEATMFVVARSTEGFSKEFRQDLKSHRVQFQVPVQFFDAAYKRDSLSASAASQIEQARELGVAHRVAQPFKRIDGNRSEPGDDLYDVLRRGSGADRPTVRFIVGRAGAGKSVLFAKLFGDEQAYFLQAKAQHKRWPRPIPFQPEHMRGLLAPRTELLVDNMLRTELAAPVSRGQFEWMVVNGFTTWFMDGLDEIYAGDPGFFLYLEDLMTRPDSRAVVNVFCRDSLVSVVDAFEEFKELAGDHLEIYRLESWTAREKRAFAWFQTADRPPLSSGDDPPAVRQFLARIGASKTLDQLSGLPFYCNEIWSLASNGRDRDFNDELDFLDFIIESMMAREVHTKRLLDFSLFENDGLDSWLQEIARLYVEGGFSGVDRDDSDEYARLTLRDGIDEETLASTLAGLRAFPFFESGGFAGRIRFTHELIADALASRFYARLMPKLARDFASSLAKRGEDERTQLTRFIGRRLTPEGARTIADCLRDGGLVNAAYTALLGILLAARPDADVIKKTGLRFEGMDLSGVRFERRDLNEYSFRRCDLSRTAFVDCQLVGAHFEGAHLEQTVFENCELKGAGFGDRSRLESIHDGRRLLDDPEVLALWVTTMTGREAAKTDPCPTALQVRFLFRKFIRPTGEQKKGRDDLPRLALTRGKRFPGSADLEDCIDACEAGQYLLTSHVHSQDRLRRAEGDKLTEMAQMVTDGRVSDGIGQILAKLCRRPMCRHTLV